MLGNRQSLESAIEGSSGLSHERLLKHEGKVHFPYSGHLVKENKSALEQCVHFLVFCPIFGRIATMKVVRPKFEVLRKSVTQRIQKRGGGKAGENVPSSITCTISGAVYKRVP